MNPGQAGRGPVDNTSSSRSLLRTLPLAAAQIAGGFWAQQQQRNRDISLAHGFAMLEATNTLRNLRIAAGTATGTFSGFWFADSDVYKWLEAVAWEMGRAPDEQLLAMADEAIAVVEAAQMADGYLDSYFQIAKPEGKWADLDHGHELYCAGHLIQAAVAFHRALGDDRLLTVTMRLVDHIYDLLGPGKREGTCGHPEIEMALVELYRDTRDTRHLTLAQLFIDRRGRKTMSGHAGYGPIYQQDHVPVREATEVAGHAVRQLYLTTGVTDLYMETGEEALLSAMHTLWQDMTGSKLYITGGIGSRFDGESFGGPYELPSDTCYCETCAAIASLQWNWRMLLVTGERRYADLFERTLHNGVLPSPGMEGASYLYVNPLHVRGGRYVRASTDTNTVEKATRPAWHNCACCPPNVMRLYSSLSHYLATANEAGVQVHQYATARLDLTLHGQPLALEMETNYPWDGEIALRVAESGAQTPWRLSLRVPEWCRGWSLMLNGETVPAQAAGNGYLEVERVWQAGDTVTLAMEMAPEFVAPHPRVDAIRGCVALQCGPIIYCFESHDQPAGVELLDAQVETSVPPFAARSDLFGGVPVLRVQGRMVPATGWQDTLYRSQTAVTPAKAQSVTLTAIPYFAWGNRGMESMRVWIPAAR